MKKTILAVVTTSLFAASANAAVVYDKDGQQVGVYGELRYVAGQIKNATTDTTDTNYNAATAGKAENFGGTGRARFGFDGKQATGYNDVALISKLEWEAVSEDDNGEAYPNADEETKNLQSRYAWLGADFANGVQATVGEVQSPFAELSDVTDTYNTYSGLIENQFDDIWDDSAKVTYAADGWDLRAAYSFDDAAKENGNNDAKAQYRYAAAAGYTVQIDEVSSLKPVIAYQEEDGTNYKGVAGVDYKKSQYAAGLGYTYDAFYLATTYGQEKFDTDTTDATKNTVWAVTTSYKVLPEWTLVAGYGLVDPHNHGGNEASDADFEKYYVLGTQYDITAKAKAFAEYKINDKVAQDDNYVVGLQYNF